ncbi:2963_t:CDS:2, partial [Funneliformis mosseae]
VGNGVRDADILALVGMAPGNFRTEDQRLEAEDSVFMCLTLRVCWRYKS